MSNTQQEIDDHDEFVAALDGECARAGIELDLDAPILAMIEVGHGLGYRKGYQDGQQELRIERALHAEAERDPERGPFQTLTMRLGGDNVSMIRSAWEHLEQQLPMDNSDRRRILAMLNTAGWR